jgi:Fic family protein
MTSAFVYKISTIINIKNVDIEGADDMNIDVTQAVHYHTGQFPPDLRKLNYQSLMPALLEATSALARYDQMLMGLHNSELFVAPLRGQEAVISSRMEGTISTLDEILMVDAEFGQDDERASQEVHSDALETLLYRRAMNTAQAQMKEGRPLSESLIKSIHRQLLSFGRGASKSPGAYKHEQNYIGERGSRKVSFVPIPPERLQDGMDTLFRLIEDASIPILLRTALAHAEFEALHPFEDGNGRMGRMLVTLMLWHGKVIAEPHFYISRYFEDNKAEYLERLRNVSAHGDWDGWCCFFLKAVETQAIANLQAAQGISDFYEEMKPVFVRLLASKYAVAALDYLFANPVFSNSRFTRNAGIPPQTAARFSRELLKAGLLETVRESSGKRPAIHRFEQLMHKVRV